MTTLEVLKAARELISDPARWAKGWFAYAADGLRVSSCSPDACRWCALGAVGKVGGGYEAMDALGRRLPRSGFMLGRVSLFNDAATHEEVLGLFDRAIAEESRPLAQ